MSPRSARLRLIGVALFASAHAATVAAAPPPAAGAAAASDAASSAIDENGRIRTQLVSLHDVVISSQVEGQVAELPLRDGDAFKRGQLLVAFDCELYEAQLHKAQAAAQAAHKLYEVDQQLASLHSVGQLDIEQARAKAQEADAEVQFVHATVDHCRIVAPFNGRVAKRIAAQYEYVPPGKPLLEILDSENLELKLIVPSSWLGWLRIGSPLQLHVDDLGKDYQATVARLGARVDPVSQTLEVSARIKGAHSELLAGMSGWASFPGHR
jgi:RND family efflux transporter MFP subunit